MPIDPILGYIDPMSGSILLQVVLGGILACFALFRERVRRAYAWLTGRKDESTTQPQTGSTEAPQQKAA